MLRRPGLAQGPSARWPGQPSLGLGEPLQSPGMWASPWGPQTERREGAKGERLSSKPSLRDHTRGHVLPRAGRHPAARGPVTNRRRLSKRRARTLYRSGRRRSGARLPGLPSRRRRALGGPCQGLEAAGVVGSCPGHRHSQQRPARSLERSRRPPVLTLLPPSSPSTGP